MSRPTRLDMGFLCQPNHLWTLSQVLLRDLQGLRYQPLDNQQHMRATGEWIYAAHAAHNNTGVACQYGLLSGWGPPYPETTGYTIPTLFDHFHLTGQAESYQRALQMADWLLTLQHSNGAFPAGVIDESSDPQPLSVFNTGQVVLGLIRAWEEAGEIRFADAARRATTWLLSVQDDDGAWRLYTYKNRLHVYKTRVAWALAWVGRSLKHSSALVGAEKNLDFALSQHLLLQLRHTGKL